MTNFVLMLTRNDVTVPDAHAILELALSAGTEHIGFKDIGLPRDEMAALVDTIHAAGRQAHLEVVSLTEGDERNSLQLGRELGFDYVVGGTRWQLGAEVLAGTSIRYFPYAGTVIGHPGTLDGTAEQILADIEAMRESVTGVNLLAYRHIRLDGDSLVQEICADVSDSGPRRGGCCERGSDPVRSRRRSLGIHGRRRRARPTRRPRRQRLHSTAHCPRCSQRSGCLT